MADASQRQFVKIGLAIVLLILAVVVVVIQRQADSNARGSGRYYYDLSNGELYSAAPDAPIVDHGASGSIRGVTAHVISCGACQPDQWQVGYLVSLSDEALRQIAEAEQLTDPAQRELRRGEAITGGTLIALPPSSPDEPIHWVPAAIAEAGTLLSKVNALCEDDEPNVCRP